MNLKRFFPLISIFFSGLLFAEQAQLIMGTGGVTGVYYPAGGAICQMMNYGVKQHDVRCLVESSGGSLENIKRLRAQEIDLAIVQSDWFLHARKGSAQFKEYGAFEGLRKVVNLYSEPFTIVARKDSNISKLEELKGKRVNIGNPGSGQRATMEWFMGIMGWYKSDFSEVYEFDSDDQAQALCDDQFDAMVFVAGSPNSSVKLATTDCESVIVPAASAKLEELIASSEVYVKTVIPGGMYRGNPEDIETFGVYANLVSSEDVGEGMIYALTQAIFEDFNVFRGLHPALKLLSREEMLRTDEGSTWHKGAQSYFEKSGMRKP